MNVAVAFDHRGVHLREEILQTLVADGHEIVDLGTTRTRCGSTIRTRRASSARRSSDGDAERGVLVCGSGVGAVGRRVEDAPASARRSATTSIPPHQGVEHDDMNVLCLGSEVVGPSLAAELVARVPRRAVRRRRALRRAFGKSRSRWKGR